MNRQLDKKQVRRAFDGAAATYDEAAAVQRRMADELVDRLDVLRIDPRRILDAGCGTGYALPALARRYPRAEFLMLDICPSMLRRLPPAGAGAVRAVCGDVERMPLASRSVDMVFCNAVLAWCELGAALAEFLRVLKPEGLLTFATFGPDTLAELAAAWRTVDDGVHVHRFEDMHNIGDALVAHQFTIPVMDVDHLTVTHRDLAGALRDLKRQGGANAARARAPGLTGRRRYEAFERACRGAVDGDGLLASTCEIVYGHAWAPAQVRLEDGSGAVIVPAEGLGGRR